MAQVSSLCLKQSPNARLLLEPKDTIPMGDHRNLRVDASR